MDPQIDTAQQRAEAIKLANELMLPWQEEPKDLEIIRAALQQARRDALAEAVKVVDEIRDAVLYGRNQLEGMEIDNDITNAVLGIIDDRIPILDRLREGA